MTPPDRLAPLFRPLAIRGMTVPNRFVMSPMTRSFSPGGVPTADVAAYYRRRAEGGTGLIITEGVGIPHPAAIGASGVDDMDIPHLYGDAALAGWRTVVDEVHAAGGLIAPQLWHQGVMRLAGSGPHPEAASTRPSGIWGPLDKQASVPPEFIAQMAEPAPPASEEEIADIIHAYGEAAANAQALGFDAIAIHAAHGYLIDNFLWAGTNLRGDDWGGDIVRRARFAVEVVREIRSRIDGDVPIIFRFSQWKQQDFRARIACDPAELAAVLGPIADTGVDVFDASQRYFDRPEFDGSPMNLAGWARKVTGRMSMAVGGIGLSDGMYDSRKTGESAPADNLGRVVERFEAGEFDLAAIGRALLGDPNWVAKARGGIPFDAYNEKAVRTLY
jgi:2,4-dienoyl-CoA reductase-like NADH-dependent reductase (Old Yellow Enzyme family)